MGNLESRTDYFWKCFPHFSEGQRGMGGGLSCFARLPVILSSYEHLLLYVIHCYEVIIFPNFGGFLSYWIAFHELFLSVS